MKKTVDFLTQVCYTVGTLRKGVDTLKKILVFDTETAGGFSAPLVYDVGGVVMDSTGFIHYRFHYAVLDIIGNPHIMDTAYYAEKMPLYWVNVQEHETNVLTFADVLRGRIYCGAASGGPEAENPGDSQQDCLCCSVCTGVFPV